MARQLVARRREAEGGDATLQARDARLYRLSEEAERLAVEHWPVIERLVDELPRFKVLSGARVHSIRDGS